MHIKDLSMYKEGNSYYISAVLQYENDKGFYEINVPKINLPILYNVEINQESYTDTFNRTETFANIDFGFGKLSILKDDNNHYFTMTCIEEKRRKMTLAEIEKELGYKIELKEN